MLLAWEVIRQVSAVAVGRVTLTLALFAFCPSANADVIYVENEEQLKAIVSFFKASQSEYLKASRAMKPCYQRRHGECQANMREAIVELRSAVVVVGGSVSEFFLAIRNNSFFYERAYSLLFLNAVIEERPRGGCDEWRSLAEQPLANSERRSLAQHLQTAEAEVNKRTHLPEFKMLERVKTVLGPCLGAG